MRNKLLMMIEVRACDRQPSIADGLPCLRRVMFCLCIMPT